ncbi:MAG: helix-turn-helix transcriptional regulator [Gaiellales bacterium]
MTVHVEIEPALIAWARRRSGMTNADLARRFPRMDAWERGDRSPTLKQLEHFARATRTPVGFFFLAEPPDELLPIPDFRTMEGEGVPGLALTSSTRSTSASRGKSGFVNSL